MIYVVTVIEIGDTNVAIYINGRLSTTYLCFMDSIIY